MVTESALEITGHGGQPVLNRFVKREEPANRLALLLPGGQYTTAMPLLYYTSLTLQNFGFDVLEVHYDYSSPAFLSASQQDRAAWMYEDVFACWQTSRAAGEYQEIALAGKSLGTLAMALLLGKNESLAVALTIWLTPLLQNRIVVDAALNHLGPAFFLAGSRDPYYDPAVMDQIRQHTAASVWIAEGANHSLEIPGDPLTSLDLLKAGMQALSDFLE